MVKANSWDKNKKYSKLAFSYPRETGLKETEAREIILQELQWEV